MGRAWNAVSVVGIALFVAGVVHAASLPTAEAGVWFTALGTMVAAAALAAAIVAVKFAWPGYREWTREQALRPSMRLWFETPSPPDGLMDPVDDAIHEVRSPFIVRIAIANDGSATLRAATLNVMVPITASIEPRDDPVKNHYRIAWPSRNTEICAGTTTRVHFTVAERDFPPSRHHVYHVEIHAPAGDVPVRAVLEGDPPPEVAIQQIFRVIP